MANVLYEPNVPQEHAQPAQIESHPHQGDVQEYLKQTNVFNPFSENSRTLIRDGSDVEYFELCETDSQEQLSYCPS